MPEKSDTELLREYADQGNEAAFREIVNRHAGVVYASALRQVASPDLARDVAQAIFTDLAHKAPSLAATLAQNSSLLGWLYRSTRFTALNLLRDDRRRLARERQVMQHFDPAPETAPDWDQVQPVLDEAMADLSDEDRDALLLRYFKNHDFRAIGLALGVSDDTAQKRVSRALERLRAHLTSRGVTTSAVALSTTLSANAAPLAPAGLAAALSTGALAGTALTTMTALTAVKTIAMTTLQKTLVTATIAVLAGAGIYEGYHASKLREQNQALQQQQAPLAEQVWRLQRERDEVTNQLAGLKEDLVHSSKNNSELLKLRGEVGLLRSRALLWERATDKSKTVPTEALVTREFRVEAKAFREKLEEVMHPPANTTVAKIASDYFETKGIILDPPKSIQFADATGSLFVHTTDFDLAKIEKLLGELTQLQSQLHFKARFIELPKETFAEFGGLFNVKGSIQTGLVGILNDEQFTKTLKQLETKVGVETLGEKDVTTLSERQAQVRADDKNSDGSALDIIPHLLSDGYTIRLNVLITGPEQLSAQANVWDGQTLILSKTEKTNPEKQILVLITTTLVDRAGNKVHSEEDLPFAQRGVPAQE